jgi:hypothetical protein
MKKNTTLAPLVNIIGKKVHTLYVEMVIFFCNMVHPFPSFFSRMSARVIIRQIMVCAGDRHDYYNLCGMQAARAIDRLHIGVMRRVLFAFHFSLFLL